MLENVTERGQKEGVRERGQREPQKLGWISNMLMFYSIAYCCLQILTLFVDLFLGVRYCN